MATILLLISLFGYLPCQEAKPMPLISETATQDSDRTPVNCSQPAAEQNPLIREAVKDQYLIRRVEFLGNVHTGDRILRQRIPLLLEGDVFTRENLVKSLKSVSRLKRIIYPVKLSDVTLQLDRQEKLIDMVICFREKRRTHRGAKAIPGAG